MRKIFLGLILVVLFAAIGTVTAVKYPGPAAFNGLNHQGQASQLYLYEKDPSDWTIVEGGAWGKMTYSDDKFVFNGHGIEAGTDYTLVRYAEDWPNVVVLGDGTSSEDGAVHIMGEMSDGGQKVWLVLSSDVQDGKLVGWHPSEYLFEYNLIEDTSYIKYEGNGIYSYTHLAKDNQAKPVNPGKPVKSAACYKLMRAEWYVSFDYAVNANYPDITPEDTLSVIQPAFYEWDFHTGFSLVNGVISAPDAVWGNYDGVNLLTFGDYSQDGVIAVTKTWYTRAGQILDFDIMFDTDFAWATNGSGDKMDLQNIATHEIGHGIGLLDVYQNECSEVTMYGYGSYGETKKQTIEQPDITGLQKLYGV